MNINHTELDNIVFKSLSATVETDLNQLSASINSPNITSQHIFERLSFYRQCGVEFSVLDEQRCQLSFSLDLLDIGKIRQAITEQAKKLTFELYHCIDSTNSRLFELSTEKQHARVCLAEYQTAGRGRHGRQWLAPYASSLCLSLAWRFTTSPRAGQLISFLPAVALIRVLRQLGVPDVGTKWPNDIVCAGQKLAGVLIETVSRSSSPAAMIIGIGLNVYARSGLSEVSQPLTTLDKQLSTVPSRSELVSLICSELVLLLEQVEESGLSAIRDEWQDYDVYHDRPVSIVQGDTYSRGVSQGINPDGSLSVEIDGKIKSYISGEISLRPDVE